MTMEKWGKPHISLSSMKIFRGACIKPYQASGKACLLASICGGHNSSSSCGESGYDFGNILPDKPVPCIELLPSSEDCPNILEGIWAVYIAEIDWVLMCLCLAVTIGLRDTDVIGHACGKKAGQAKKKGEYGGFCLIQKLIAAIAFIGIFGSIELLYVSSCMLKVPEGGWVPLVLSFHFVAVVYIWNYRAIMKIEFDVENKVSLNRLLPWARASGWCGSLKLVSCS